MELFFESASEWRAWLAEHHATEKVTWLIFYKVHTRRGGLRYAEALDEALCYGWIDSLIKRLDDERYLQKFTPRTNLLKWSDVNIQHMRRLIAEGRMTGFGLAKVGNPAVLEREPAGSGLKPSGNRFSTSVPVNPPIPGPGPVEPGEPDVVREAFAADPAAEAAFRALTPGRRRLYLRWILDGKRDETRRKRLRELLGLLREGKSLPMK